VKGQFDDSCSFAFIAHLVPASASPHQKGMKGTSLGTGLKLFLSQEQCILKHYMYLRFVLMWSIYFNLGLSMEKKKVIKLVTSMEKTF
jgi:hypothetical protein